MSVIYRHIRDIEIYRHIQDIRTICVHMRTLYKHIRLLKIIYVCVRIRTYSVRILRTYIVRIRLYLHVYVRILVPKPVRTFYTNYTNYTYVYKRYTNAKQTLYKRYTNVSVRSTYVYRSNVLTGFGTRKKKDDNRICLYMYVYCVYLY